MRDIYPCIKLIYLYGGGNTGHYWYVWLSHNYSDEIPHPPHTPRYGTKDDALKAALTLRDSSMTDRSVVVHSETGRIEEIIEPSGVNKKEGVFSKEFYQ